MNAATYSAGSAGPVGALRTEKQSVLAMEAQTLKTSQSGSFSLDL